MSGDHNHDHDHDHGAAALRAGAQHGISHATLQVEPDDHRGCEDVSW